MCQLYGIIPGDRLDTGFHLAIWAYNANDLNLYERRAKAAG
jgi:hypothetical protein